MQQISAYFGEREKKVLSERSSLIEQLFSFHNSSQEALVRKRENWKRYVSWLKEHRVAHSPERVKEFKKTKSFLKLSSIKTFCFFLSHIPTEDLYYVVSVCRDRMNRGEGVDIFLRGSIKPQNLTRK